VLLALLQTAGHLARVTRELVEDLAADGVAYAELRFSPGLHVQAGLTLDQVLAVAGEAAAEAQAATGTRRVLIAALRGWRHRTPRAAGRGSPDGGGGRGSSAWWPSHR
jgi:adenosine deaminase